MPDAPQVITNDVFYSLKHPLQRRRFALALFFALVLFPLIGVGLVAGTVFLVVPLIALFLWLSARILFARFLGNCILVSELNYPRIHHISEDLKAEIGFKKPVIIFVYEQGNFNAYLYKFLFYRRAVFLNSELLEAGVTDDELRWLVGRFIGYLRARRQAGFWGWTIRAAQHLGFFNLFLLPYERALVYSGDRIALQVIHGDVSTAVSAMQKLLVGRQLGYSVNPGGMVDQHRQVKGSFFAFLARLGSGFPHMTARYVDLIEFAKVRYPEQFARFEVENPGLPADLGRLGALPQAAPSTGSDPVFASLAGAVVVLALLTLFTVKVLVPRLNRPSFSDTQFLTGDTQPPTPGMSSETTVTETPPTTQPDTYATASQAQAYTSADGRFSAQFPGTPAPSSQDVSLSGGQSMTIYQTQYQVGNASYAVAYCDYPPEFVSNDPQATLASVRDGVVKAEKATLTSDDVITLGGVPGRAYAFTAPDGTTTSIREFLDGQRLYQVVATTGSGADATVANDFLTSFRITGS